MWATLLLIGGSMALLATLLTVAYRACLVTAQPSPQAVLDDSFELESLFPDSTKPFALPTHQEMSYLTGFTLPIEPHGMIY
jgi:hypothetical protein